MSRPAYLTAIGLMSGTSLDGVDAAAIRTDGIDRVEALGWLTCPYPDAFRQPLRACLGKPTAPDPIVQALTDHHVDAVAALLDQLGLINRDVHVVGFHGQTLLHRPEQRVTVQIGDAARLAAKTGIDVVAEFRQADVASGGQGAPFAPLYHRALARDLPRPLAVLNLGGVGNVTWIDQEDSILAFDTGPANAMMDDLVLAATGARFDRDGRLARSGMVDQGRLAGWLAHPFFDAPPPKSLDRDDFVQVSTAGLSAADGLATLAAFTVAAVERAVAHFPAPPVRWLVTGGGRHNGFLMSLLAERLGVPVAPVEAAGWRGDSLEAEAFAYLAVRSLNDLPLSVPGTTGVPAPCRGGRLFPAP